MLDLRAKGTIVCASLLAGAVSCSLRDVSDLDRETSAVTDGGAAAGDSGAVGCAVACGDPACPCPAVEQLAVTSPAGTYGVDVIEVTAAEYRRWLGTHPTTSSQRPE